MFPVPTILHPTDFSSGSEQALQVACALARDLGAGLVVLHVVPPPLGHGEIIARRQENGFYEQLWNHLRTIHAPEGNVRVEHRLADGDIVEEILRNAAEVKAGLIVMGTHGRTGLTRLLMGSVAEQVLRRSPCPVLTVRAPVAEEARESPRGMIGIGLP